MSYYSKYTDRMDIHIEEYRNTILIQQKWRYNWFNLQGTPAWTYLEKKEFHNRMDCLIWGKWGGHFQLKVKGSSQFAKDHAQNVFDVNFDLMWVTSDQHWTVEACKIPVGAWQTSSVSWDARKIKLDTEDVKQVIRSEDSSVYEQYPIVHEFGHASGNSIYAATGMHGDEYKNTSAYLSDKISVMNIGNELRQRHMDYLLSELNTMLSNTSFYVYNIQ